MIFVKTTISFFTATERSEVSGRGQRMKFVLGIVTPLTALGIFKYANFFIDSFCTLFGIQNHAALQIILPVGISFYTFQALSYNIDVYFGKLRKERSTWLLSRSEPELDHRPDDPVYRAPFDSWPCICQGQPVHLFPILRKRRIEPFNSVCAVQPCVFSGLHSFLFFENREKRGC